MNWTMIWALFKKLDKKIDDLETVTFTKVTELPETGEPNVIYFVPKETAEEGNYSDEYIWDADLEEFEKIGDTQITPESDFIFLALRYVNPSWTLPDNLTQQDVCNMIITGHKQVIIFKANSNGRKPYSLYYPLSYNTINTGKIIFVSFDIETSGNFILTSYFSLSLNGGATNITIENTRMTPGFSNISSSDNGKVVGVENSKFSLLNISQPTDYTKDTATAPLYDSTATYAVGDIRMHDKELYKCNTIIDPAEEWDSTHWTKTDILSEMPESKETVIYTATLQSAIGNSVYVYDNSKTLTDIKNDIDAGKNVYVKANNILFIPTVINSQTASFISLNTNPYNKGGSKVGFYYGHNHYILNSTAFNIFSFSSADLIPDIGSGSNMFLFNNGYGLMWKDISQMFGDEYSTSNIYNIDDIIVDGHSDKILYKCLEDNVTGAWNVNKWQKITVMDAIDIKINKAITSVLNTSY